MEDLEVGKERLGSRGACRPPPDLGLKHREPGQGLGHERGQQWPPLELDRKGHAKQQGSKDDLCQSGRGGVGPGKDRAQTEFCMIPRGPRECRGWKGLQPWACLLRAASLSCGSRLESP